MHYKKSCSFYYDKMVIKATGNVGINTNTPVARLDVKGIIKVEDQSVASQPGMIRYNSTTKKFQGYTDNKGDGTPGWVDLH